MKKYQWLKFPRIETIAEAYDQIFDKYGYAGIGIMAQIILQMDGESTKYIRLKSRKGTPYILIKEVVVAMKVLGICEEYTEKALGSYEITISNSLIFNEVTSHTIEDKTTADNNRIETPTSDNIRKEGAEPSDVTEEGGSPAPSGQNQNRRTAVDSPTLNQPSSTWSDKDSQTLVKWMYAWTARTGFSTAELVIKNTIIKWVKHFGLDIEGIDLAIKLLETHPHLGGRDMATWAKNNWLRKDFDRDSHFLTKSNKTICGNVPYEKTGLPPPKPSIR